jgi:hypothetical protein
MYEQEIGIRFPVKVENFFSSTLTESGVLFGEYGGRSMKLTIHFYVRVMPKLRLLL